MHVAAPYLHPSLLVDSGFDDTAVRRACLRGDLVRLTAGRYLRREHWAALDARGRHVMQCLAAVSRLGSPVVVSHASAAAFWGLPRLGPWPPRAHVIDPALTRAHTGRFVSHHVGSLDTGETVERFGALVTSPARTGVDLAFTATSRQAVVSLDHLVRTGLCTLDELRSGVEARDGRHGCMKARDAVGFADGRANRAGESLSRVVMRESRLVAPELQHGFVGPDDQEADVDFFWPEQGIVGEFDGKTKYVDSERWSGLPADEVVVREKIREDWIRALPEVRGFVRWTWRDVVEPGRLAAILLRAGVPRDDGRFHAERSVAGGRSA